MNLTKIIILCVVAGLIVYDCFAYWRGGVDATISRVILSWSRWCVWIVFAAGILCGHLFFAQDPGKDSPQIDTDPKH
jgi:hypothetical protein